MNLEIDYNSEGKWSLESVQEKYAELRTLLGGAEGFILEPRTYTNPKGAKWTYNVMDAVADGIQLEDNACIELAVEYINDNVMDSTTGYIRERIARSLRHASLTEGQKQRLAEAFLKQLEHQDLHKEFKEYIRLFKTIGIEPYRKEIEKHLNSKKEFIQRAASKLLA
jgi:hypothetical protein